MSSTDTDPVGWAAGALWDEVLAPLAEAMRRRQESVFALGPDPSVESYYGEPTHRVMRVADFAFPGGGSVEGLVDSLGAYWSAEGRPELAAIVPRLRELAAELGKRPESENSDVSPFVYTMY